MKILLIILGIIIIALIGYFIQTPSTSSGNITPSPVILPVNYKRSVINYVIPIQKHAFQTFNNCGPATLSMALSYNGLDISQQVLGQRLRPYQNPQGNNDDKSVFFPEMAMVAEEYGLLTYSRPNGDIELLKTLITNDIPVVVRTWLKTDEDIGHYRLVRGYDNTTKEIIQDDSYQGKNLRFSYQHFSNLWQPFSYDYLIVVPKNKQALVEAILGDQTDEKIAWQYAQKRAENEKDLFNLSVASFYLGDYQRSVESFEQVQPSLPPRMLWYQTEPIQAYLALKNYSKVFAMTDKILANDNLAYSELYVIRGKAYREQGQEELAKQQFDKAIFYNKNISLD